jgi:cytochrome c oxidase cbb3-type subunit 4
MQILLHSIWTVLVFIAFVGIVIWAYSSKRKRAFDEAARLALDDDDHHQVERDSASKEQKNG